MSKQTLGFKKSMRDAEPKLKANIDKISAATGIVFSVDADWDLINVLCEQHGFTDRAPQVIYEYYMTPLADSIIAFVKDPLQKEAFINAFGSAKKIAFSWDEQAIEGKNYHWIVNNGGVLEIHVPKARFNVNVYNVGDNFLQATQPQDDGIGTKSKMSLRDYEADGKKALDRIKAATGQEYQLQLDWLAFDKQCTASGNDGHLGKVVYNWITFAVADAFEKICKDDLAKEAVVEATGKKIIHYRLTSEAEIGDRRFNKSSFEDGVYVLSICRENFVTNLHTVGTDIESLL